VSQPGPDTLLVSFEEHRPRLLGLAYRLLGSAADAEDVVQEAFLRWYAADRESIDVPAAWLTTVVTNLCLNRLTLAHVQRESYVGPWLPEPVLTADGALGPLETTEQRESVSFGLLVLLERLTPPERAVYVLREAFAHSHAEIAQVLGITEEHSRQLLRRARRHVDEGRRRFTADARDHRRIVERFLAAVSSGDAGVLEQVLAADAEAWADGGGTTAARRPILGRDRVARYLAGLTRRPEAARVRADIVEVNGAPAILFRMDGTVLAVMAPEVATDSVVAVHTIANPAKLAFLATQLA
jgi:RNA polymerase sigma-70 factor (TIGR02957 family)